MAVSALTMPRSHLELATLPRRDTLAVAPSFDVRWFAELLSVEFAHCSSASVQFSGSCEYLRLQCLLVCTLSEKSVPHNPHVNDPAPSVQERDNDREKLWVYTIPGDAAVHPAQELYEWTAFPSCCLCEYSALVWLCFCCHKHPEFWGWRIRRHDRQCTASLHQVFYPGLWLTPK